MEQRISLITLGVADLRRAMDFYGRLGWEGSSPDGEVAFFQAGGMVLGLWDRALLAADSGIVDAGGYGGVTLAHNVRSPAEVDAVLDRGRRRRRRGRASRRRRHGAATPGCSPTRTATRGRSRTTRTGGSRTTGRSA